MLTGNQSAIVIAGSDPVIKGNRILDNSSGIFVLRGTQNVVDNAVSGGCVGIGLGSDDALPFLAGNVVCKNDVNLSLM